MRLPTVILFFALVLVSVSASLRAGASISTVNAVVGDRSAEYFERGPSLEDPSLEDPSREDLSLEDPSLEDPSLEDPSLEDPSLGRDDERIADHLSFVLERLRKRSARCLDAERARRRTARLDDLERYVTARQFPRHAREGEGRQPRFMDEDGRLCAVGALVAASAGKDEAIRLAAAFEYAFLEDVDDPGLRAWADVNGFSIRELAAIQPAYPMKRKATIERPWLAGLGLGGGVTASAGSPISYALIGLEGRYSVLRMLAFGVSNAGPRFGASPLEGTLVALGATPIVEMSWWFGGHDYIQAYASLGPNMQYVFASDTRKAALEWAADAAIGLRVSFGDFMTCGASLGALVTLDDGYVLSSRAPAGLVAPTAKMEIGFRFDSSEKRVESALASPLRTVY